MFMTGSDALVLGASLCALAALAHVACVVVGGPAYRRLGAGERMAHAAEAGRLQPAFVTLALSSVLLVWAAYATGGRRSEDCSNQALVCVWQDVVWPQKFAFPEWSLDFPHREVRIHRWPKYAGYLGTTESRNTT